MHVKHTHLEKPISQQWARQSISFVGTNCGRIEQVMKQVGEVLSQHHRMISVDADHHHKTDLEVVQLKEQLFKFFPPVDDRHLDDRLLSQNFDLALINGNHYPADQQVVFIDSEKEASLLKRKAQLTNVLAFIEVDQQPWSWLNTSGAPCLRLDELPRLIEIIQTFMNAAIPPLHALVLAGGKSTRMGVDKSRIDYHGTEQEIYVAELCQSLGLDTVLSKRQGSDPTNTRFSVIEDSFVNLGPYGAILSAFRAHRNVAWLVLACDLPFLDRNHIEQLIEARDTSKFVTAFKSDRKDFAEPLAAIYEPKMYPRMLQALGAGYSCPTKLLRNSAVREVVIDDFVVDNINTKEEMIQAKASLEKLKKKGG